MIPAELLLQSGSFHFSRYSLNPLMAENYTVPSDSHRSINILWCSVKGAGDQRPEKLWVFIYLFIYFFQEGEVRLLTLFLPPKFILESCHRGLIDKLKDGTFESLSRWIRMQVIHKESCQSGTDQTTKPRLLR